MKRRSILLVDDEPIIVESLVRDLTSEDLDLDVAMAGSGEEAIEKIGNGSFNLVVTDLIMPEHDGFQVLKAAKQKDPQTMVIILTGFADLQAAIDALRLGADDFMEKPCDTDELLFRMSNCFIKQDLLRKVHLYENILPVCVYCNKIRDDRQAAPERGKWYRLEDYFSTVQQVDITHGCCPECFQKVKQEIEVESGKDS